MAVAETTRLSGQNISVKAHRRHRAKRQHHAGSNGTLNLNNASTEPDQDGTSVLERALKNQVGVARMKQGRAALTSFLIADAQSVKNTDSADHKGYDAGKKVSGIKRHMPLPSRQRR